MDQPRHILIDTDPGIDDAMALLFLRAMPSVRIAAITTVFGNADVATTTRNACYLAERFSIDAPIYGGAGNPLHIEPRPPPVHVHGRNGLGDVELEAVPGRTPTPGDAHEAIVRMVRALPHQLSLLALGPLTNIALALRHDPGIADLVSQVVVMGGAFGWNGRRGNASPVAEANVRNDPHAADEVLGASWPVTMVGLDVTARCVLPARVARHLAEEAGDAGRFLWDISRDYETLYRQHDGLDGCCLHDVAAATCLLEPGLFRMNSGPIRVVEEGIAIGQTIQLTSRPSSGSAEWNGVPAQKACSDVDVDQVIRMYSDALITHARADPRAGVANSSLLRTRR